MDRMKIQKEILFELYPVHPLILLFFFKLEENSEEIYY